MTRRGGSACPHRRRSRPAAQAAPAGLAQRLLLRPRSHDGQEPAHDPVRGRELDQRDRQGRASHPDVAKEPSRDSSLVAPDEGGGIESFAELRSRDGSSSSVRGRAGSISSGKITAAFGGPAPTTVWAGKGYSRPRLPDRPGALEPRDRRRLGRRVLTTTTGVTFTGDGSGNALALRTTTDRRLARVDRRRQQLSDHDRDRRPPAPARRRGSAPTPGVSHDL